MSEEIKNKAAELNDGDLERVTGGYDEYYPDFNKKGTFTTNPRYSDMYYCTCCAISDSKFNDIYKNSKSCPWCSPVGNPCPAHICGNCNNLYHY